jgi:hypothetical protein
MLHLAGKICLENDGRPEHVQQMAGHESPRTAKLDDWTKDEIELSEVERIRQLQNIALTKLRRTLVRREKPALESAQPRTTRFWSILWEILIRPAPGRNFRFFCGGVKVSAIAEGKTLVNTPRIDLTKESGTGSIWFGGVTLAKEHPHEHT